MLTGISTMPTAPTTWSEMAHQELVVNLSARERTRQEILWEVVASEERLVARLGSNLRIAAQSSLLFRYVAELRSLVDHYANPLLHPLLSTSPPLSTPSLLSKTSSPAFTRESTPAASSSSELPIAARFLRSSPSTTSTASFEHLPEIHHADSRRRNSASPTTTRNTTVPPRQTNSSTQRSTSPSGVTSRLASFALGRSRQASSTKSRPSKSTRQPAPPPPRIPDALRTVLESTVEMLRGHDELSTRLKDQWTKAFPLVRGLAGIWSDQVCSLSQ